MSKALTLFTMVFIFNISFVTCYDCNEYATGCLGGYCFGNYTCSSIFKCDYDTDKCKLPPLPDYFMETSAT